MPEDVVPSYQKLCESVLEPIRQHLAQPLRILSGYRNPQANQAAGGVAHSQHEATSVFCAADWWVPGESMQNVFDWIRLESGLVWDQVILEHGKLSDILHTSWAATPRRIALEGATANRTGYKAWEVK